MAGSSPFSVGNTYTREQIQKLLGLEPQRGGNWATGHTRHNGDTFIFPTLEEAGRTGHKYDNRLDGDRLYWQTKTTVSQNSDSFRSMVEPGPGNRVFIFTRDHARDRFTFRGFGEAESWEGNKPVSIVWKISAAPPGHAASYLLLWNPDRFSFDDLPRLIDRLDAGERPQDNWSTGVRRSMPIGSKVFLLRVGQEPKGIVGEAFTTGDPVAGRHWQGDGEAVYVSLRWTSLIDPSVEPPLDRAGLPIPERVQGGGIEIAPEDAALIEAAWGEHLARLEGAATISVVEGQEVVGLRRHRRRERSLRGAKLEASVDLVCEVCGLNLDERFGDAASRIIEVHHLHPIGDGERVTTLDDLALVCPTCHRYIHSRVPMLTIPSAREYLTGA